MSKFLKRWLTDLPGASVWLAEDPSSDNNARCKLCAKTFSLSNMGLTAVRSHQTSKSHKDALTNRDQRSMTSFLGSAATTSASSSTESSASSSTTTQASEALTATGTLPFIKTADVARAEILWACKCVTSHYSYRSAGDIGQLFKAMFPDSSIASQFSMSYDKTAYVITYGLAPFFKSQVVQSAKCGSEYVICFDEALNKIAQKCQMDVIVRFWCSSAGRVSSRYLTSVFLGHTTAADLKSAFVNTLQEHDLQLNRLLQVSTDGPNVNWSFLTKLKEEMGDSDADPQLIELGSCGLHVVSGAFQTGHRQTKWNINSFLSSVYYLFKDSPARRADFLRITGVSCSLKRFCATRWTENSEAVTRALELLPHLAKYTQEVKPIPAVQSFQTIKDAITDPMLPAKLEFFRSVSQNLEPFLLKFQTNKPMAPLLYEALQQVVLGLLTRFIKSDVMKAASTITKLLQIDVSGTGPNCSLLKDIGIGFGAEKALKSRGITEMQRLTFREDCRTFLCAVVTKIFERSPLKYRAVRAVSSVSPRVILNSPSIAANRMQKLLELLLQQNIVTATVADRAKTQYTVFCNDEAVESTLKQFVDSRDDLGELYNGILASSPDFTNLWQVVRKVLVLSHGNAVVESGFSVNRDVLVDNLSEQSLVAQRLVYDAINAAGGPLNIEVSTPLMHSVRAARSRYRDALESRKRQVSAEQKSLSERKRAAQELKQLEVKKRHMEAQSASEIKAMELKIKELRDLANN